MLPFSDPEKAPLPDKTDSKGKIRADYAHALLSGIIRMSKEKILTPTEVCNFATYLQRVGSPEWGGAALSNLTANHPYLLIPMRNHLYSIYPIDIDWKPPD